MKKIILLISLFLIMAPSPAYSIPFLERCRQAVVSFFTQGTSASQSVLSEFEPLPKKASSALPATKQEGPLAEGAGQDKAFKILLVRHAPYLRGDSSIDFRGLQRLQREKNLSGGALSLEGVSAFKSMLAKLPALNFDLMAHSPYVRTWQTAGLLSRHYRVEEILSRENDQYTAESVFEEIKASSARQIILVDHQPFLQDFIDLTKGLTSAEKFFFKRRLSPGNMVLLEFPDSFHGEAKIDIWIGLNQY